MKIPLTTIFKLVFVLVLGWWGVFQYKRIPTAVVTRMLWPSTPNTPKIYRGLK